MARFSVVERWSQNPPRRGSLWRRVSFRAAAIAGALALVLVACELAARLLVAPRPVVEVEHRPTRAAVEGEPREREQDGGIDVLLDWSGDRGLRLVPNVRATIHDHTLSHEDVVIETSRLGVRHPELGSRRTGERRLLVVGDSTTFGDYAAFEDTYTAQLQRLLTAAGGDVTVINAGLPGASTADELAHYLELRDAIEPDSVLVAMYLNDAQNSSRFYAREVVGWPRCSRFASWAVRQVDVLLRRYTEPALQPTIDPDWRERFRAGRDLRSGDWLSDRDAYDFEIYNAYTDFGLGWNDTAWAALEHLMAGFAAATDQRHERLGMMLLPVHIQVLSEVADSVPQEHFAVLCRRLDLPCLDLLPALRAAHHEHPRQRLYFDHCHMTPTGNQVVATALAEWPWVREQ